MKLFKKLLAGVAMSAALLPGVQASPVTVAGVTWDPASLIDFSAASVAIRQFINPTTGILSGFGTINTINGSGGFCAGCELTFQFGGFTPISLAVPSPSGSTIQYKNGFVNVYVDYTPETVANSGALTMTNASTGLGDGLLWLALTGHNEAANGGTSFTGTVTGNGTSISSSLGGGILDVVAGAAGGLARDYFDTDSKTDFSDFAISTSFTSFIGNPNKLFDSIGTGNFNSLTANQVPEPASIALLGLGLLGMAAIRRRKSVK